MRLLAILIAICVLSSSVHGQDEAAPSDLAVTAQGLRIVKPAPEGQDDLRAFSWTTGTTIALLVSAPKGGLIAFDDDASELKLFLDDKRSDLLKAKPADEMFGRDAGFGMMPSISEDGKYCLVEANVVGVPTEGSTRLAVGGDLVVKMATEKKDFTAESVALKKGTKVEAGSIPMTISEAGEPDWGDAPLAITLEAKTSLDTVADIQFFDVDGKEIESETAGESSMGFGNQVTVDRTYNLGRKVDTANITITYWTDLKNVTVPFQVVVGVGL